jgi:two-component system chemotaxis sensor kinase CheA
VTADPRLLALFAQEAGGRLDRLGDGVLALERAAGGDVPAGVVAGMLRDAHTLKSSSSLVALDAVTELASGLEDALGELAAGERTLGPELADDLLAVVDGLRAAAGVPGAHGLGPDAAGRAQIALERLRAPAAAPRPAFTDPMFRQLFVEEVGPQLDRLVGVALDVERRGPEPDLVAELFRGAHSLKGSSALVGFDDVSALAHVLEDLLGGLRAGTRPSSPAIVDGLLGAFDAIREAVAVLAEGGDAGIPLAAGRRALEAALATEDGGGEDAPAAAAPAPAPEPEPKPNALPDAPAPDAAAPDATPPAAPAPDPLASPGDLVPVAADRLDRLVRLTGEAVAAELRVSHLLAGPLLDDPDAEAAVVALRRTLRGLQKETLRTRMTSLDTLAAPLRRAVRDVARAGGKDVDYVLAGDVVELDRAVLDGLRDPLLHLVRNAVDHGLEPPAEREAAGKPRRGTVTVRAVRRGPEILVSVADDGAGLDLRRLRERAGEPALGDEDAADLIFRPGLSTSRAVTDISGRGVGLDVVRTGVEALRGRVEVASRRGHGTTFTVAVPLTLAVVPCVLVAAGGERYALPTHATRTLVEDPRGRAAAPEGSDAILLAGRVVPLGSLAAVVGASPAVRAGGPALVLEGAAGRLHALQVDEVLGQRDVTVEELGRVLPRSALVAGASIEPDGTVLCVLDPVAVVERAARTAPAPAQAPPAHAQASAAPGTVAPAAAPAPDGTPSVLVVDDVATIRALQRAMLERGGYRVQTARDGQEALELLRAARPDLLVTDVEMPRLDGPGLCRAVRATPGLASLPVLVVTANEDEGTHRRALEAGADGYLLKTRLTERRLLDAVASLLGRRP